MELRSQLIDVYKVYILFNLTSPLLFERGLILKNIVSRYMWSKNIILQTTDKEDPPIKLHRNIGHEKGEDIKNA